MPQVQLQQGDFDAQIRVDSEAPADVYALADRIVGLAGALVRKILEAQFKERLRDELGPRGQAGNRLPKQNQVDGENAPECPDCGCGAAYRKGTRKRVVEAKRLGEIEFDRPCLECKECGRSYVPYSAGSPGWRRYGRQALKRPMEATLETSYRRGAEAYPESPSASTLWRRVQEQSPEGTRSLPERIRRRSLVAHRHMRGGQHANPGPRDEQGPQASHSLSIAIYTDRPEAFVVQTTAPAEREMRELNRRFENGGQWTQAGAENLLRWHQIYRHAPKQ
jgi:hypothetical protein